MLFVRTTYGALHIEEHYSAGIIRPSRASTDTFDLLSGPHAVANVRHCDFADLPRKRRACPLHRESLGGRGLASAAGHGAEPPVRGERPAHGSGRPGLRRPGDRQPDQRPRHRHRRAADRGRQGWRHHRARRRRVRHPRQPVRHRGHGRPGECPRTERHHAGAARRRAVGQRHHVPRGQAVHRRMPRRRTASRVRPGRRTTPCAAGERAVTQRHGGRPRRAALLPGDGRQRDLAHPPRRRHP